jgi:hypothetical protein
VTCYRQHPHPARKKLARIYRCRGLESDHLCRPDGIRRRRSRC